MRAPSLFQRCDNQTYGERRSCKNVARATSCEQRRAKELANLGAGCNRSVVLLLLLLVSLAGQGKEGQIRTDLGDASLEEEAMRVIGYLRVSTEDQATNGHGLEAQRTAITAEALRKGSDVEWVEDAGRSGRSRAWPTPVRHSQPPARAISPSSASAGPRRSKA